MSNTIFESASIFSSVLFDFQSFTVNLFVSMLLLILDEIMHVFIFGLKKYLLTEYTSVKWKSAKEWYLLCLRTS